MAEPAEVTVTLSADVYEDVAEFRSFMRELVASIERESTEERIEERVDLVLQSIGRDAVKLYCLVEVVQKKVEKQCLWATSAGSTFYRLLFARIDSTLGTDDFEVGTLSGSELAAKYILDKSIAIFTTDNWTPRPATLDLIVKLFEEDRGSAAVFLACGMLEHMAESFYLFFNQNLDVFLDFAGCVVPQVDNADREARSGRLDAIFRSLKNCDIERTEMQAQEIEGLINDCGRSEVQEVAIGVAPISIDNLEREVSRGLKLFDVEPDWRCFAVTRLVVSVAENVKIGSPYAIQSVAYKMIEAMIKCQWLLLHHNLYKLTRFLLGVGPVLDSMARPSPSLRLTELLESLNIIPGQAPRDRSDIEGLLRNLGRPCNGYNASTSDEDVASDEHTSSRA